ncbi:hypothetical protein LCL97_08685 [Seohaeicola saemankumensis]|nr:hypothetical protein [Seohaeicola saemankumensis]MCA0870898.1 hypothetical protein [Seohaeicola saemankumensis]
MLDWYLTLLKRRLGPDRALNTYAFLYEYGLLILSGLGLAAALGAYVAWKRPSPHTHDAYVIARLIGTAPLPSEVGAQKTVLDLRLADGTPLRLVARNAQLTGTLDSLCLERRRFVDTGALRFRVAPSHKCPAP